MAFIYTVLYIIGILCSLVLFAPSVVPGFVKFPVALIIVLFIIFLFNLSKKDTKYSVKHTKRKIVNHGLFNPLVIYLAASTYLLGFLMIIKHLTHFGINDVIGNIDTVFATFEFSVKNGLFTGLIFILLSIFIYLIRYGFKNNAKRTSLRFRGFWYLVFTLITLLVSIFTFISYADIDLYAFILEGLNLVVFAGVVGLVLLLEIICLLVRCTKPRRKARKERKTAEKKAMKETEKVEEVVVEEVVVEEKIVDVIEEPVVEEVQEVVEDGEVAIEIEEIIEEETLEKVDRKTARFNKVVSKERARVEKKLSKKEAKLDKKLQKRKEKLAKE